MRQPSDLTDGEVLTSVIHGTRDSNECGSKQRENRNPSLGLIQISAHQLWPFFFTVNIRCAPVYQTNATFRRCIRIERLVRQRILEIKSVHPLWTCEIYSTARMTTWKTSEAIVKDVAIRLMTYCRAGKTKRRIDCPRVRIAATDNIYAKLINAPSTWYECRGVRVLPGRGRPTVILTTCVRDPVRESDRTTEESKS
jgi:hypothetical protein